jgi:hypothetical protein
MPIQKFWLAEAEVCCAEKSSRPEWTGFALSSFFFFFVFAFFPVPSRRTDYLMALLRGFLALLAVWAVVDAPRTTEAPFL